MQRSFIAALTAAIAFAGDGDYIYNTNGADWVDSFETCKTGTEQSPIDLPTTVGDYTESMKLELSGYTDFTLAKDNADLKILKADSVYSPVAEGGFKKTFFDGSVSDFQVLQFHFHAPSEHTVDGLYHDLEIHFVHKYADTDPMELGAVIGVFFSTDPELENGGTDNAFLAGLLDDSSDDISINVKTFLDGIDTERYWSYDGSLTTPPCTEGIKWTVIDDVQPMSQAQLDKFKSIWEDKEDFAAGAGNNRVVQDLKDRTLWYRNPDLGTLIEFSAEVEVTETGALSGMSLAAATLSAAVAYLAF